MTGIAPSIQKRPRLIGALGETGRGPLLIAIGSIHGNEPAGTIAVERVLDRATEERIPIVGRFVGLVGNREGLARDQRFIDHDLNRVWPGPDDASTFSDDIGCEGHERAELMDRIEEEIASAVGPVAFLDLHSTSAPGPPFSVISDSIANRRLATSFRVPVVLGLEESIRGSLMSHLGERGYVAIGVEGGQHQHPRTVDHHEAVLWIALETLGIIPPDDRRREEMERRLEGSTESLPRVVELVYRHEVSDGESFRMAAPYRGFEPIIAGELLAWEGEEPVTAVRPGVIMLPRYQRLGDDGFFIARPIRPFWLGVSTLLRRTPIHRLLPLLPKVRRDPASSSTLLVRRDPLHRFAVMAMHLLGYRRWPDRGNELVFRRRAEPGSGAKLKIEN